MKKLYLLILLIPFFLYTCVNIEPKYKSPQGEKFFSAKKTVDIMADLHIADAMTSTNSFSLRNKGIASDTILYDCVFAKYGTTRQEYLNSLLYHSQNNIDSLDYYYEKKIEQLTEQQINDTL